MTKKFLNAVCLAATVVTLPLAAQTPPPASAAGAAQTTAAAAADQKVPDGGMPVFIRPETPEQRKARIGTAEDPGLDPDSTAVYWRFGKAYRIEKIPRLHAVYDHPDPTFVRFATINIYKELYQHNQKWTWMWIEEPIDEPKSEDPDLYQSTEGGRRFADVDVQFFQKIRSEFSELTPPSNDTVVRFEESSTGLPSSGSWRNSLAVADMNNDGHADLIAPPERGSDVDPAIFLGDGTGKWKFWREVKWPSPLAYGGVAAADFNKDGNMDLAFAVHLRGVFVFLGDGKGNFTNVTEGLPRDYPTRRIAVTDVDRDGYVDVVAISEGPSAVQSDPNVAYGRLRAFLNRDGGKRWEGVNVADPAKKLAGDYLAIGNFNGDKYPDFAAASIYFSSSDTLFLSKAAKQWTLVDSKDGELIPASSYYFANTAAPFSSPKRDDAIVSFARFWPGDLNPRLVPRPSATTIVGIDRISFEGTEPKRTAIMRWAATSGIWGLGSGDFNGDGKVDVMFSRRTPREAVLLLNDGKGNFTRAAIEGLEMQPKTNYDLQVADVNGDKRPDVIVMYETAGTTAFSERSGAIQVFLNRGASKAAARPAAAATK
jgi:hypothetical protein